MILRNLTYLFILVWSLVACTSGSKEKTIVSSKSVGDSANDNFLIPNLKENELYFNNNIVKISKSTPKASSYVQEIEIQKNDLIFRAKRISSESHLRKRGLKGKDLAQGIEALNGQQLFYVEFQEKDKVDVLEKYHAGNMDNAIQYLSFKIGNDFRLVNSISDTIEVAELHYEPIYHVAPFERILLSFSGVDPNEEVQLLYDDKFFAKRKMAFHFASSGFIENNVKKAL